MEIDEDMSQSVEEVVVDDEDDDERGEGEKYKKKRRKKRKSADEERRKLRLDEENEEVEHKLEERRKKKIMTNDNLDEESQDDEDHNNVEDKYVDPSLALALRGLQDDMDQGYGDPLSSRVQTPVAPPSTVVDKVYTEKQNGKFAKRKKKSIKLGAINPALRSTSTGDEELKALTATTPLDLGMQVQRAFRSLGIFCHGFLAGLAFWHLIMVYVLMESEEIIQFLALYSPLSQPLHFLFYLLTVICTISILDRYDLATLDWRQIQLLLTLRSGGLAIIVYAASLIITLATTGLDDKISLFAVNSTLFEAMDEEDLKAEMNSWRALNLCRAIGVILGWILVAIRPGTDQLHKHLRRLGKLGNADRYLNDVQRLT